MYEGWVVLDAPEPANDKNVKEVKWLDPVEIFGQLICLSGTKEGLQRIIATRG